MIVGLEVEGTFKKLSPFLEILTEMFQFTEKMASTSQVKERQKNIDMNTKVQSILSDVESKINNSYFNGNAEIMNRFKELTNKIKTDFLEKSKSPNT